MNSTKKILVTGAAGFIGFHLSLKLLKRGYHVVGIDNINDYYDVNLKYARLKELGVDRNDAEVFYKKSLSSIYNSFEFVRMNLEDKNELNALFEEYTFDEVCNLAAQAGVRYSIENPDVYIQSNIVGFLNVLECCRNFKIQHLLYASSSSVYGANTKIPFSERDNVDTPISLYAATKKSNELMAHTYSHLYGMPTTGMRFFTVYGPWGRPDMALYLFTEAIANKKPIKVFNHGKMERDFTYIDDIINGIELLIEHPAKNENYRVVNIGNGQPQKLEDFIQAIELELNQKAIKEYLPLQDGDVPKTWADVAEIKRLGYASQTGIEVGVKKFIDWYKKENS
ncbi:MAG: NAD-dependent epimerase [Flavobacteriaceae bacterium]|nr:NAD-dependent epimerase [Flavobacteriaceae bacterium]